MLSSSSLLYSTVVAMFTRKNCSDTGGDITQEKIEARYCWRRRILCSMKATWSLHVTSHGSAPLCFVSVRYEYFVDYLLHRKTVHYFIVFANCFQTSIVKIHSSSSWFPNLHGVTVCGVVISCSILVDIFPSFQVLGTRLRN